MKTNILSLIDTRKALVIAKEVMTEVRIGADHLGVGLALLNKNNQKAQEVQSNHPPLDLNILRGLVPR